MNSIYSNGPISILKNTATGWSLIVDTGGVKKPIPFSNLDKNTIVELNDQLTTNHFPLEAIEELFKVMNALGLEAEYRLTIVNSQENLDILNKLCVYWFSDNEKLDTVDIVTRSQSSRELIKIALKKESSNPYPNTNKR